MAEGAEFLSLAKLRAQMYAADCGNPRFIDRELLQIKQPYCGLLVLKV
jgi:hypothetical protein